MMVYSLTWLPEVLEQAGLKVAEVDGWRTRGRAEMGTVRGVMCHHTATVAPGNMPTLNVLIQGRSDLSGPLAQLGLGCDGTYYVVAAGRANHAGAGNWKNVTTGNSSFIGIEAEYGGRAEDQWPPVQVEAYHRGVAAILRKIGADPIMCCGHKEYALPIGRKSDPSSMDMVAFRKAVTDYMVGKSPPPLIPAANGAGRPTLRRGATGGLVSELRVGVGLTAGTSFDAETEAAVRQFQRDHDLVPDGIVGPKTWASLSAAPAAPVQGAPAAPAPAAPGQAAPAAAAVPAAPAAAAPVATLPPLEDALHKVTVSGRSVLGPDGKKFGFLWKLGVAAVGATSLSMWLKTLGQPPAAASVVAVLRAMSANEGGLEAVNTYDTAHLSFGMFQWTAGAGDGAAELAVLLEAFKDADAQAFQDCFGRYKLDAAAQPKATTGFLVLDGARLQTAAQKETLRSNEWAYRFWRAGHHPVLRRCEFDLAASRIERFRGDMVAGHRLGAWLTSELGIALVLDEHVNRPANVPRTLAAAIAQVAGVIGNDPAQMTDDHEHELIDTYIEMREGTMTNSGSRATSIIGYVTRGLLSDKRGSFVA